MTFMYNDPFSVTYINIPFFINAKHSIKNTGWHKSLDTRGNTLNSKGQVAFVPSCSLIQKQYFYEIPSGISRYNKSALFKKLQ